ncbi:MAG: pyridoxamine 5'-phosphate oxidase family protein [Oceanospirillaceae bacterium]|nr:pyridoxamine 5'-phosphate oxidase family protein [Oceanospirillaceae bacterium]
MRIDSEEQLRELYGNISARAQQKQLPALEQHSIHFLSLSPFATISTFSTNGEVDCSPRGGAPGFARVISANRIAIADARGNNRLDSLTNIVQTGRIGALFVIPGIDETLRINGSAYLSIDPLDLEHSSDDKNPAKTVIIIDIEDVYLHCAKAIMRSKLWHPESLQNRSVLPSMSRMIADQTNDTGALESQAAMIKRFQQQM